MSLPDSCHRPATAMCLLRLSHACGRNKASFRLLGTFFSCCSSLRANVSNNQQFRSDFSSQDRVESAPCVQFPIVSCTKCRIFHHGCLVVGAYFAVAQVEVCRFGFRFLDSGPWFCFSLLQIQFSYNLIGRRQLSFPELLPLPVLQCTRAV